MTGLDVRYPQREVLQLDGQLLLIKSVLLILFLKESSSQFLYIMYVLVISV